MAVHMIFKYSKRFRFAPSFNNKGHVLINQAPPILNWFRHACQLPRRNSTNGLSFLSRSDWIMHLSWRKWKSTSSCEKQSYSSKVIVYKSCNEQLLWNRIWDFGWFWVNWAVLSKSISCTSHKGLFTNYVDKILSMYSWPPPTPMRWLFLLYKRWQKVNIFGPPTYPVL